MTKTDPVAGPSVVPPLRPEKTPATPTTSFSQRLGSPVPVARAETPARNMLTDAIHSLERGQRFVDRVIRRALAGRDFSQAELLAIQAGVYRYTQELELFSRMVEKTIAAVRQTMQTQG